MLLVYKKTPEIKNSIIFLFLSFFYFYIYACIDKHISALNLINFIAYFKESLLLVVLLLVNFFFLYRIKKIVLYCSMFVLAFFLVKSSVLLFYNFNKLLFLLLIFYLIFFYFFFIFLKEELKNPIFNPYFSLEQIDYRPQYLIELSIRQEGRDQKVTTITSFLSNWSEDSFFAIFDREACLDVTLPVLIEIKYEQNNIFCEGRIFSKLSNNRGVGIKLTPTILSITENDNRATANLTWKVFYDHLCDAGIYPEYSM